LPQADKSAHYSLKAMAEVRRLAPREGWRYHHVQPHHRGYDQYAEAALTRQPRVLFEKALAVARKIAFSDDQSACVVSFSWMTKRSLLQSNVVPIEETFGLVNRLEIVSADQRLET
jgi:hypothetical protein